MACCTTAVCSASFGEAIAAGLLQIAVATCCCWAGGCLAACLVATVEITDAGVGLGGQDPVDGEWVYWIGSRCGSDCSQSRDCDVELDELWSLSRAPLPPKKVALASRKNGGSCVAAGSGLWLETGALLGRSAV